MFEVSGDDIQKLDDTQLRTLVARLAVAELRRHAVPESGVTAGGDQNAPDGGLDVRVDVEGGFSGDFIPRVPLGIQVKKPDLGPAAIKAEMSPAGVIRPIIRELAESDGCYIIVSARGTVADRRLQERRDAMSASVRDLPAGKRLHIDFYDRDRLAAWVNQYPGVAAWIRARVGQPLSGWQAMGDWSGTRVGGDGTFIADDATCLVDSTSTEEAVLAIVDGVDRIRKALCEPGRCVRLIGMSGVGKTRLLQALFQDEVGEGALDPSLAVYTDYSETPDPTAKQLALHLVETGQRAILVVDNCNPQTHSDLAKICGSSASKLSLISVEYDVRDDEPERTKVFRLQSASEKVIMKWLEANFSHVSQVDRERIAEFSGGNFRVAGVLAETVRNGDSLGDLKDRELFRRIFEQRNDPSDDLLKTAEALALVYSFDGEDTSDWGELSVLASVAEVQVTRLYGFVSELKNRGIIQTRGRWRAILPHAIANRLAAQALERITPDQLDAFVQKMPPRMRKSFSRRLGYLHRSEDAQKAVARYLAPNGPMGDLLAADDDSTQILRNIAPVAPESVLTRIEAEIEGPNGSSLLHPRTAHRWQLTLILKSLAYTPELFDRATSVLAKFVEAEAPDENHNSARGAFEELFHLHLSGTRALPDQRRKLVRSLFNRSDGGDIRAGKLALRALLESSHFTSSSNFDFGSRPRDFGWHPATYGDVWNWLTEAVELAVALSEDSDSRGDIRSILAGALRGIVGIESCLDAVEGAAQSFLADGEWIDGWLAVRGAIRFDGDSWRPEVRQRVEKLEAALRPSDPLNTARAYVIEGRGSGFDLLDGDKDEEKDYSAALARLAAKAESIGRDFGSDAEALSVFLPEVLQAANAPRAFPFGIGLAQADAPPLETWQTLRTALIDVAASKRNHTALGGFLYELRKTEPALVSTILDGVLSDPELMSAFVYLQAQVGIDAEGVERLRRSITYGLIEAWRYGSLASGVIGTAPQAPLADMLYELSALDGGTAVALDVLHMAIYCLKSDGIEVEGTLLDVGHKLLLQTNYSNYHDAREYRVQRTIKYSYNGPRGEQGARELCQHLKRRIASREVHAFQLDYTVDALFEVQPLVALDELLLGGNDGYGDPIYRDIGSRRGSPLEKVPQATLWQWAGIDPKVRYPVISGSLNIFATKPLDEDDGLSPLFLEALERAPDRAAFLERSTRRLHPNGWSGNLSAVLDRRASFLAPLSEHDDPAVREWAESQIASLRDLANYERGREGDREESFE